ncbi:type IV pilus modification protein PilV [Moraxella sp. ZY210820]|uniref:type IV pilus modification protein PilV n=1 Tax=unclassified Moraxella TaxID=2685852 RepID=UPI00272F686F|nr:type IV pilus modification protein PilV [Moraxella sp. ZY210820]WLF83591.1 type IV pilus modification protein PilV [Moraxella sp. ZY210820]
MKSQQGVGLLEVLVALVLLGVAVLGFAALQLRAINASLEANNNVQAVSLARDLAERMRVNRDGLITYQGNYTGASGATANSNNNTCATSYCTPAQLAQYDFAQVQQRATEMGMSVAVRNCQGITSRRACIYVAWEDTTPTNGTGENDCTNGTTYVPNAKCIILEAYNYD